jgi:hypothetical protein
MTESSKNVIKCSGASVRNVVVVNRFIVDRRVNGLGSETGVATRDGFEIVEIGERS